MTTAPTDLHQAPFGTLFGPMLARQDYRGGRWSTPSVAPLDNLSLHPATHALHYGSTCFEGLKAYRWADDSVRLFRADRHAARLVRSAELLHIPCPDTAAVETLIRLAVEHNRASVPRPPGSLYVRPTLIGTEHNIGAAATPSREALLFVLTSPVGDYFTGGDRALRILIEDKMRAVPGLGQAKTGAGYVAALGPTLAARAQHQVDQVLFCPGGDVQETGASNFILLNDRELLTKPLDDSFLHGVTRDSVLRLAEKLQYRVIERDFTVDEIFDWVAAGGEAALSGTAAVLAGVGTFIHQGREIPVGDGQTGSNTRRLREALTAIQRGESGDDFGFDWSKSV